MKYEASLIDYAQSTESGDIETTRMLFVYSVETTSANLIEAVSLYGGECSIICLSPHVAFDNEKKSIEKHHKREIIWSSFYEYLSQSDMEYCDKEADRIVVEIYGDRVGHLQNYFQEIKRIKNELVARRVFTAYQPKNAFLLAGSPGIDVNIWQRFGCQRLKYSRITPATAHWYQMLRQKFSRVVHPVKVWEVNTDKSRHLFIGTFDRVQQYLDSTKYISSLLPYSKRLLFHLTLLVAPSVVSKIGLLFRIFVFLLRHTTIPYQARLLSSLHEHKPQIYILAEHLGVCIDCLQDGYLPSYYPSAYLAYYGNSVNFLSFDHPSSEIFRIHGLNYSIWPYFRSFRLPHISPLSQPIKQILFIASGAGDWTALKNRSDEDLAFMFICMAARSMPEIHFIFRPHPLWVLPEHQGSNSIIRLVDYVEFEGLDNLTISTNAITDSNHYLSHRSLSHSVSSIYDEIKQADVVIGDHSQALVEAALAGKIIASINAARRTEFFINFTRHGIPLLRCGDDVVEFLLEICNNTDYYCRYNNAIDSFNRSLDE